MASRLGTTSRVRALRILAAALATVCVLAFRPAVAQPSDSPPGGGPAQITFDDWTTSSNIGPLLYGQYLHGAAWGDVNNDGYPDLFAGAFDLVTPNRLLVNNGDGTFSESVQVAINVPRMYVSGAAFADFNNDGWVDLVVGDKNSPTDHTRIYRNDDGGAFTDVTSGSNLDFADFPARTPFTFDYDGDGRLDILLQHDVYAGSTYQSRLMRGDGNFGFTEVTSAAGLPTFGGGSDGLLGLGGVVGDFNGDGTPDVYSAAPGRGNWLTPNSRMFLNDCDGTFSEYTRNSVFNNVADWNTRNSDDWPVGAAAGDLNNDGKLDLVAGHHFVSSVTDAQRQQIRVFLNDGNSGDEPIFVDVTDAVGIEGLYTREPHVEIEDMDNDGYMDIVVSVVMTDPGQGGAQRPVVFRNTLGDNGTLGFELNAGMDPTVSSGHWLNDADRNPYYYPGSPLADVDRDGRLDFFGEEAITTSQPQTQDRFSPLFRNTSGAGNNWLEVLVESDEEGTNRQGIGSRVLLFEAGHAGDFDYLLGMQEIQITNGFSSGTEPIAHFGLGDRDLVDVVIDRGWGADPWSILGLSANTRYTATATVTVAGGRPLSTNMTGAEEAPGPGDPDASGFASLTLNQGRGEVCFDLNWADIDGTVTAGHIHEAPAGEPGPIVVPLFRGEFDGTDEVAGCVDANKALVKDIRKNPSDYYVNVHSTEFPDGAVRGQLGD